MSAEEQGTVNVLWGIWNGIQNTATRGQRDETAKTYLRFIGFNEAEMDAFEQYPEKLFDAFKQKHNEKKEECAKRQASTGYFWVKISEIFPCRFTDEQLAFLIEDGVMAIFLFLPKLSPVGILKLRGQVLDSFLVKIELQLLEKEDDSVLMALVNLAGYRADPA